MTTSNYLALIFGVYTAVVSIPMIFDRQRLVKVMEDYMRSEALLFFTGILVLIGGLSVVYFHNILSLDWRGFITLVGWIAAIEGALMIIMPSALMKIAEAMLSKKKLMIVLGLFYLALGIFFLSRAFI